MIGLFLAILRLPRTANPSSPDEQELTPETVAFLGPISVLVAWYGIICWTHWGRQQVDLQTIATLEASPRGIHGRVSLQPPPPPIYHRFTPFLWLITSGMAQFKLLGYTWRAPGASTALIQVSTVLCVYVISTAIILLMPMFDPTWSVVGWEGKLTLRGIHWLLVYLGNTPLRQWSKHVLDRVIPLDLETDPLLHSRALCWAAEKLLSGAEADETFCYWILLLATQLSPVKRVFLIERIVGRTMYSSMWDAHTLEYFRTLRPPMRTNLAKLIFDIAVLSVQDLDEFLTSNRHLSPDDILADVCSRTYHLRALGCVAALTFLDRRLRVDPAQKLSLARVFIQLLDVLPPSLSSPESMFPTWCDHSTSENAAPLFIAACVSVFLFLHPILSNIVDSPDAPPLGESTKASVFLSCSQQPLMLQYNRSGWFPSHDAAGASCERTRPLEGAPYQPTSRGCHGSPVRSCNCHTLSNR